VDREASGDSPADPGPRAKDLSTALESASIEAAMRKVADWQIAAAEPRFNQQWTFAALYDGLLATTEATGDPRYAAAVEHMATRFDWRMLDTRFPHADDEAVGRAYLDLYRAHPAPERIQNTREILDRLVARPDEPGKPVWWWCDSLFMAPPVLARMSAITGDRKYLAYMDREWSITSDLLYDHQEHLYFRDATYLKKTEKNDKPLFWARGNGWVLAGLAEVLTYMPANDPLRPKYVALFREMAQRIAGLQDSDGLWRTGLLDPDSYNASEVSGSAFFTYGMAWGINNDLLAEPTFRPVVERAWAGMVQRIYASGRLGSIQPIGAAPDSFVPSSSYVYGVGGFLLAGNELHRLSMRQNGNGKTAAATAGAPQVFVHPGVLVSREQLEYLKRMVAAHTEPFYSAFLKAQRSPWGALDYTPKGPPKDGYIKCGPISNPNIGCKDADNDGTAAYAQALLWIITANRVYADNAVRILNIYGQQLKGYSEEEPYTNAPLQAAWDGQHWPRAAEIIRYSGAGWKDPDIAVFERMLRTAILPLVRIGSPSNGNWEVSMNEALLGIGVFTNDRALFDLGLQHWRERTPSIFYLHGDGPHPVPSPRGNASWYGQSVFDASVDGIQQETCRDFNHAQYSIAGTLDAAETARIQGVDLYREQASRLTAAMEFNSRYLLGQPVPASVCGGQVKPAHNPTYEIGYNEFHNRLGMDLPLTWQYIVQGIRQQPTPVDIHMMIFETLTHGGDAAAPR
jgi:rhamnogalacturonyl hydrolase YesR